MTETTSPPHPGVRFPPPLIYLAGFLVGLALERSHPLPIDSAVRAIMGIAGVLVWLVLFASAVAAFRRAHTTLIPNQPATAFVTRGPYRFTRNPMYISLVALYLGLAALLSSWWPVGLLPIVVALIDRLVIVREERYLAGAFPVEYRAYTQHVRRWL